MTNPLITELEAKAPSYCDIYDDGATFKCAYCNDVDKPSLFWYVVTPNGHKQVLCKTCIDADWLELATKVEGKI